MRIAMPFLLLLLFAYTPEQRAARQAALDKSEAQRAAAVAAYQNCVVEFVTQRDTGRLSGYEMADAATSACSPTLGALHALMIEQGYEESEIRPVETKAIAVGKQQALEALARRSPQTTTPAHQPP